MFRVMTTDPQPNGSYRGLSSTGRDAGDIDGPFEVVFKVPRLEAHIEEGQPSTYTIVVPKYAAEEMRTQAAEERVDGEQPRDMRMTFKRQLMTKKPCVYVSYLPGDQISCKVATYIKRMLLDEYKVPGVVLEPDDGRLNYIDFDMKIKDCTHFVACLVPRYFDLLQSQQGRPFLEVKAATSTLPSQRIVCVYPDSIVPPTQQRIQSLMPIELRKAFVTKPHVFYHNLGHMDVLETCLARFFGIEHLADLMQLPMSACLETASLGMFILPLYSDLGCTSVGDLAILQETHLNSVGMDKQQIARFFAVVEQEVLCLLLEANGVGHDVWRRLVSRHAKELHALPAIKTCSEAESFLSFAYTCNLPGPAIRELCKGDVVRAQEVSLVLSKLWAINSDERADAAQTCHFPEQDQSVKTLVARLWTPDVSRSMRAEAAELIRRKSLNAAGLEEIRHIAGLESVIKLVEEGLPAEKIAALWTLRNFGLVELFRSRMATMGVMPLCVGILEDTHQPVSVHHAAAAVLQVATTADEENVKRLSETNALPRLIACLYVKHRALKVAALGTLANMVTLDANKAACSRLRAVPRLVVLLSNSTSPAVSINAVGAINLLVRNDENRLKSWRCGAVEKLKFHVSAGVPHVSAVAAEAIQVLMAGPRIHPSEHFLTTSGRRLHATQMRSVIHRLNTKHTFLQGVNIGAVGFQSAHPENVAALSKRPATAGACLLTSAQADSALNVTRVTRQDFERARPSTANPSAGIMAGGNKGEQGNNRGTAGRPNMQSKVSMALREVDDSPFGGNSKPRDSKRRATSAVPRIDPFCCSSEFMRKLSPRQQIASVDRLTKGKPLFPASKPAQGNRMMTRALSTARPPDKLVKPKNSDQESRRQSGRHFTAMASVKYKTVTGKIISADKIEGSSRRLSLAFPDNPK